MSIREFSRLAGLEGHILGVCWIFPLAGVLGWIKRWTQAVISPHFPNVDALGPAASFSRCHSCPHHDVHWSSESKAARPLYITLSDISVMSTRKLLHEVYHAESDCWCFINPYHCSYFHLTRMLSNKLLNKQDASVDNSSYISEQRLKFWGWDSEIFRIIWVEFRG